MLSGAVGLAVAFGLCALVNLLPMPDFFAGLMPTWTSGLVATAFARHDRRAVGSVSRAAEPLLSIPSKRCATRREDKSSQTCKPAAVRLAMLIEIIIEAWIALKRNVTRSSLTMLGVVWGIATVTLLIAYGGSFRSILVHGFDAFGKSVVICWPQQTSEQPGGQRAGKKVVLEQADIDMVKATAPLVKHVCRETVRRPGIAYGDRMAGTAPCAEFAPNTARCATKCPPRALARRQRRTGAAARDLPRRPPEGTTVQRTPRRWRNRNVSGVRFTVIGVMDRKIQLSNYFSSDDESSWIPYSAAGDLVEYALRRSDAVFEPIAPQFEKKAMAQVLAAVATRQSFSPTDPKAIQMFGRDEFRPVIDALTIGLQVLLDFHRHAYSRHRRRRRDEHHAGLGGRTHPRNWIAARPGRAENGTSSCSFSRRLC